MRLSRSTAWVREPTALSRAIDQARGAGRQLFDLTSGNPTRCGLGDRRDEISSLGDARGAQYVPEPRGSQAARLAVGQYYRERSREVSAEQVLLTASSSEAYAWLFKLLCNPGDAVLAPQPSYPLFPYIADLEHVVLAPYTLMRAENWRVDIGGLRRILAESRNIRAMMLVHPGNPTGTFIHPGDVVAIIELAHAHDIALIVDEVFLDYASLPSSTHGVSFAGTSSVNTFVLSGLSKVALLPQVKLGWVVVSGPDSDEALARLEIIADTYLSVSAAVQLACPALLAAAPAAQGAVRSRIRDNRATVDAVLARHGALRRIPSHGGWYACIEVPRTRSDDAWCERLIDHEGIIVHPGHFFDMQEGGVMVVSLLPERFGEPFERAAHLWAQA